MEEAGFTYNFEAILKLIRHLYIVLYIYIKREKNKHSCQRKAAAKTQKSPWRAGKLTITRGR